MAPRRTMIAAAVAAVVVLGGACSQSGPSGAVAASPGRPARGATTPATETSGPSTTPTTAAAGAPSDVAGAEADDAGDHAGQPQAVTGRDGARRGLHGLVDRAVRDLAERRDVAASDITVVLAERIVWPDTSIGCPLRDRQYVDEPRPGTRIHLRVDGVIHRYHTGGRWRDPFLCDPSASAEPPIRRIEP